MDDLRNVIEHSRNHHAYRSRLKAATGPVLPFLGLILSEYVCCHQSLFSAAYLTWRTLSPVSHSLPKETQALDRLL